MRQDDNSQPSHQIIWTIGRINFDWWTATLRKNTWVGLTAYLLCYPRTNALLGYHLLQYYLRKSWIRYLQRESHWSSQNGKRPRFYHVSTLGIRNESEWERIWSIRRITIKTRSCQSHSQRSKDTHSRWRYSKSGCGKWESDYPRSQNSFEESYLHNCHSQNRKLYRIRQRNHWVKFFSTRTYIGFTLNILICYSWVFVVSQNEW